MKIVSLNTVIFVWILAVFLVACTTTGVDEEDVVAVRKVLAERADAIAAKDINRYRALFLPDYFDGKSSLEDVVSEMDQAFKAYDSIKLTMQKSPVDLKMNSARVIQRIVYDVAGGEKPLHGHETLLLRRVDGEWKISGGVQLGLL